MKKDKTSGEVIRICMDIRGKTPKDAMEFFGLSANTISTHRNGDSHKMETIRKYADWLDFEVWEMFALAEGIINLNDRG